MIIYVQHRATPICYQSVLGRFCLQLNTEKPRFGCIRISIVRQFVSVRPYFKLAFNFEDVSLVTHEFQPNFVLKSELCCHVFIYFWFGSDL